MAEMRCVTVSWNYADLLSRRVAMQILEDGFKPDCIVALAKGGWFVGCILYDFLGAKDLLSLNVRHYESVEVKDLEISPFDVERIRGKSVLVVDDLINTGSTMKAAINLVKPVAKSVKTASLFMLQTSEFIPDYIGEYLWDYTWVIFPWNFVEDVSGLIIKVLKDNGELTKWSLKGLLFSEFGLDPLNLEISHPGRFDEVLKVLELNDVVEEVTIDGRKYWRLKE